MITILGMHFTTQQVVSFFLGIILGMIIRGKWA